MDEWVQEAQKFILENENHNRKLYTGYLGPIKNNSCDLFVNLRCMQIFKDEYCVKWNQTCSIQGKQKGRDYFWGSSESYY